MGTLMQSPLEYAGTDSGKPTKDDRHSSLLHELMDDTEKRQYFKKKYDAIQKQKAAGGKGYYKNLRRKAKAK
jgi:hypothetical protein